MVSPLFEQTYEPASNYSVANLGLAKRLEDTSLSFIGQVPSAGQVAGVSMSGDEMNKLKQGYRKLYAWYLQQRDLREIFTDEPFEGMLVAAFITKQQLKGKNFGGINPAAGEFGMSMIRPESWYATYAPFSSTAITTATEVLHWPFTTPANTTWSTGSPPTPVPPAGDQLFWVNTQLPGTGLLNLRDNVAFYVPFLADENPSVKIDEIDIVFNQKPTFPVSLHDLQVLNLNVFRLPIDWLIGINSALLQVQTKENTASAADALKPLGIQFSTAEYGIQLQ